jgi:hypothetical protein
MSRVLALTREELAALEGRARKYTSPYRDVSRAKIVLHAAEGSATTSSPHDSICPARSSAHGATGFLKSAYPALRKSLEAGGQPLFPPASSTLSVWRASCQPNRVPLARWSIPDLHREVVARGIVAQISGLTLWR